MLAQTSSATTRITFAPLPGALYALPLSRSRLPTYALISPAAQAAGRRGISRLQQEAQVQGVVPDGDAVMRGEQVGFLWLPLASF